MQSNQPPSESRDRFKTAFEEAQKWPTRENRFRLFEAAGRHMRSGTTIRSEIGPLAAAFAVLDYPNPGAVIRFFNWSLRVYYRKWKYRSAPMWNDFEMAHWALTKDPEVLHALAKQIHSDGNMVRESGHWMVQSVCQQDPQFKVQWTEFLTETKLRSLCMNCRLGEMGASEQV